MKTVLDAIGGTRLLALSEGLPLAHPVRLKDDDNVAAVETLVGDVGRK